MTALVPVLATKYFPNVSKRAKNAIFILLGSWFVALFAQIEIPLRPVPITGQTFAVLLVGALLGSKRGAMTLIAYIVQGGSGLPFFAGGASGLSVLTGATLGYLVGFIGAAYVVGLLAERGLERSMKTSLIPFIIGTGIIYAFGVTWLGFFLNSFSQAIQFGLLPFLIGDAIKLIAAAVALPVAWKFIK